MFKTAGSISGFVIGLCLTVGLLLTPHLLPWGIVYRAGFGWSLPQIAGAAIGGLSLLALTLWVAGRLIGGADSWREARAIASGREPIRQGVLFEPVVLAKGPVFRGVM